MIRTGRHGVLTGIGHGTAVARQGVTSHVIFITASRVGRWLQSGYTCESPPWNEQIQTKMKNGQVLILIPFIGLATSANHITKLV